MKPGYQYEALAPLECCQYKDLNRVIGISVSDPFEHHGLKKQCVEMFRETISVNTMTTGNTGIDADNWKPTAIEWIDQTIGDLGTVIEELEQHRDRLTLAKQALEKPEAKPAPPEAKFKVGDRVKVKNDEENESRLSDFECDLQMCVEHRTITGRQYDIIADAIENGKPWTITAINTDMGSIAYEAQTRNVEAPFCFDGEDLELIP